MSNPWHTLRGVTFKTTGSGSETGAAGAGGVAGVVGSGAGAGGLTPGVVARSEVLRESVAPRVGTARLQAPVARAWEAQGFVRARPGRGPAEPSRW